MTRTSSAHHPTTTRVDGQRRTTQSRTPARRTKAPRAARPISGRAAALGLLLVALTLAYAYPVRVYLAQQAEINQLRTAQAQQRDRIDDLKTRIQQWNDPDFIITQARTRLQLVRRGELLFVVQADPQPSAVPSTPTDQSWVSRMWSNVQGADDPDPS